MKSEDSLQGHEQLSQAPMSVPAAEPPLAAPQGSDQILAAIQYLARLWRKPESRSFLTAGLPLDNDRMTSDLIAPAMARIGVVTASVTRSLHSLADYEMP